MMVPPVIIHFRLELSVINHPAIGGTLISGNPQLNGFRSLKIDYVLKIATCAKLDTDKPIFELFVVFENW